VPQPPSDGDEAPAKPTPKAKSEEAVSKTKSAVAEMVASRAGLGGLQSALAAAGPIGVAVIAAEKAINDAVESINRNTELLRRAGDAAARVAGNDNFGGLMSAADGVAESFGRIPVVGGLLEAQFKQVTEILKQGNAIGETLVRRGEELARYSPELAYTSAINQVRRLHADVREAERMGPAMASLMDSRGRLEIAFREAMMPLREQITFMQIGMTERLNAALEAAREAGGGLRGILEGLRVVSQGNFDQVRELVRRARARDEERRVADADRRLQEVQEKLDQQLIPEFNQPDLANIQPPDLRLNIPIFNNP
jgi:hypothetical protein